MQPYLVLSLWLVYILLTGNLELPNVVAGLLVSLGITWLLHPGRPGMRPRQATTAVWAFVRYTGVLAADVLRGGLQVMRLVLDPRLPIQPGIIAIPSGCRDEMNTALSAHSISLSPGELVVEIDPDGVMYTHVLDVTRADQGALEAQRRRAHLLSKIFP